MAKRKPKPETSPSSATPPPVAYAPTEDQLRAELITKIEHLSETHPLAYIDIRLGIPIDGIPNTDWRLSAALFDTRFGVIRDWEINEFRRWLTEEVRPLWELSTPHISSTEAMKTTDQDGGFVRWLWSRTQKSCDALETSARAIDPLGIWVRAVKQDEDCALRLVPAEPRAATAADILRVAEMGKGLGNRLKGTEFVTNQNSYDCSARGKTIRTLEMLALKGAVERMRDAGNPADYIARIVGIDESRIKKWLLTGQWERGMHLFSSYDPSEVYTTEETAKIKQLESELAPVMYKYRHACTSKLRAEQSGSTVSNYFRELRYEIELKTTNPISMNDMPTVGDEGYYDRMAFALARYANTLTEADWSTPRKKADWISLSKTSNRKLTDNGWDSFRETHSDRIKQKDPRSRSWLFSKSLCVEYGFSCPEFNK